LTNTKYIKDREYRPYKLERLLDLMQDFTCVHTNKTYISKIIYLEVIEQMNKKLLPEIEKLISPFLEKDNYELVEMEFTGSGKSQILSLTVWHPDGLNIDKIGYLSRHISDILDNDDIIPGSYMLEVSSPGLDRPLKTQNDFRRATSEIVEILMNDGQKYTGNIISTDKNEIVIENDKKITKIPIIDIEKGKIIIEF